ncbi:MAG: hypothetical protein MUC63_07705 [Planctomycetes bacterium]|nr:hypothetical protein [Planctomycetota bacterium]
MRRTIPLLAALALGTLTCSALRGAEDAEDAAAKTRGAAFLQTLREHDATLAGTYWFGLYVERKNVGTYRMIVEKATEGSGAAYRVRGDARLLGDALAVRTEDELLDARFSLLSRAFTETSAANPVDLSFRREGLRIEIEQASAGGAKRRAFFRLPAGNLPLWSDTGLFLLARRMDRSAKATLVFEALKFPALQEGFKPVENGAFDLGACPTEPVRAEVQPATGFFHRGEVLAVQPVQFWTKREGQKLAAFQVQPSGRILQFYASGFSGRWNFSLVAGTEQEARRDLDIPKPAARGAASPRDAVLLYLDVMVRLRKVDDLDGIFDWDALKADAARTDPKVRSMETGLFAEMLKAQIRRGTKPLERGEKDRFDIFKRTLYVPADGDQATFRLPQEKGELVLRMKKAQDRWRIVGISTEGK